MADMIFKYPTMISCGGYFQNLTTKILDVSLHQFGLHITDLFTLLPLFIYIHTYRSLK